MTDHFTLVVERFDDGSARASLSDVDDPHGMPIREAYGDTPDKAVAELISLVTFDN